MIKMKQNAFNLSYNELKPKETYMNTFCKQTSKYAKQMALFLILFLSLSSKDNLWANNPLLEAAMHFYEDGRYPEAHELYCDLLVKKKEISTQEDCVCAFIGMIYCESHMYPQGNSYFYRKMRLANEYISDCLQKDEEFIDYLRKYSPFNYPVNRWYNDPYFGKKDPR
jgi:hypothetical protein